MTTFMLLTVLGGVLGWLVWRQQPQRDADAAQTWARFHQYAAANHLHLLYIEHDYQHAQQGSKAFVSIYDDPTRTTRDAWFWWTQVQKGSVVAVRLSQGWGPHTNRDDVLYIGAGPTRQSGIYASLDAKILTRARRYLDQHAIGTPAGRPATSGASHH